MDGPLSSTQPISSGVSPASPLPMSNEREQAPVCQDDFPWVAQIILPEMIPQTTLLDPLEPTCRNGDWQSYANFSGYIRDGLARYRAKAGSLSSSMSTVGRTNTRLLRRHARAARRRAVLTIGGVGISPLDLANRQGNIQSEIGETEWLVGIYEIQNGNPSPLTALNRAIVNLFPGHGNSVWNDWRGYYWSRQGTAILASELEHPAFRELLRRIERAVPTFTLPANFGQVDWTDRTQARQAEIAVLRSILSGLYTFTDENNRSQLIEQFSFLISQNLLSQAMLTKSLATTDEQRQEYRNLLHDARVLLVGEAGGESRLVPRINDDGTLPPPPTRDEVIDYIPNLTARADVTGEREVNRLIAMGHVLMGQIISSEANEFDEVLAVLQQLDSTNAGANLSRARDILEVLSLNNQESALTLARLAQIDPNNINSDSLAELITNVRQVQLSRFQHVDAYLNNAVNMTFEERSLQTGRMERVHAVRGMDELEVRRLMSENLERQAYLAKDLGSNQNLALLGEALCHLNAIISVGTRYINDLQHREATPPRHLAQITNNAQISRARIHMALLGELNQRPSAATMALLGRFIRPQERTAFNSPAGVSQELVLTVQGRVLRESYNTLSQARVAQHTYPESRPIDLVRDQQLLDLRQAMAENLIRQAFIARDQGDLATYERLLRGPITLANGTNIPGAMQELRAVVAAGRAANTPITWALAHFWQAKILVIEAGSADTVARREEILTEAEARLQVALDANILHSSLLSSAYQTQGEIFLGRNNLRGAEQEFTKALQTDPRNYEARANLADVFSQQGNHEQSTETYTQLISYLEERYPGHLLLPRLRLGLAETEMRLGSNYSTENIANLERAAADLFTNAPAGSFLIPRAINDLVEVYSVNEDNHQRIIELTSALTDRTIARTPENERWVDLRERLTVSNTFLLRNRFLAGLYLKRAEATSWIRTNRNRFRDSQQLLATNSIPQDLGPIFENDRELRAEITLLRGEVEMRRRRRVRPMLGDEIRNTVMASQDPGLISRYFHSYLEGLAYGKDFSDMATFISANQENQEIRTIFERRGQDIAYARFQLDLRLRLADARLWGISRGAHRSDWTPDYRPALTDLADVIQEAESLNACVPTLETFAQLALAQAHIRQGNIYRSHWVQEGVGRDYPQARDEYQAALQIIEDLNFEPKQAVILSAQANLGLAELFGNSQSALHDPPQASEHYYQAYARARQLPEQSEERDQLLLEINKAYAQFSESHGDLESEDLNLAAARVAASRLREVEPEVSIGMDDMEHRLAEQRGFVARSEFNTFCGVGSNGARRCEYQLEFGGRFSLAMFRHLAPEMGHVTTGIELREILDMTDGTTYSTQQLGVYSYLPRFRDTSIALSSLFWLDSQHDGDAIPFFTRRPHVQLGGSLYNPFFTIDATLQMNFDSYDYWTAYLRANINMEGFVARNRSLTYALRNSRVGLLANTYSFWYQDNHRVYTLGIAGTLTWDPAPWLRTSIELAPMLQYDQELDRQHREDGYNVDPVSFILRGGARLDLNINRYLTAFAGFDLQYNYDVQQASGESNSSLTYNIQTGLIIHWDGNSHSTRAAEEAERE